MNDFKFAFRQLLKNAGSTAVAVLTLALGIGATTAIGMVMYEVLLRPLPYPDSDRLVQVLKESPPPQVGHQSRTPLFRPTEIEAWANADLPAFSHLAAYMGGEANLSGNGDAERVRCGNVSSSLLPALGARVALGRGFLPQEDRPGGPAVVLLSHSFWERRYGADPNILGRTIALDLKPYEVVGVLDRSFRFVENYEVLVPLATGQWLYGAPAVLGRLNAGAQMEEARAELDQIFQTVRRSDEPARVVLVTMQEHLTQPVKSTLFTDLGSVAAMLLIACVNVANLLLARVQSRRREISIRVALGASQFHLVRQTLAESGILALLASVPGYLAAVGTQGLLRAFIPGLSTLSSGGVHWWAVVLAFGVALVAALLTGLPAALQFGRQPPASPLKEEGSGLIHGWRSNRVSRLLVMSQVALTVVTLSCAGLLLRSYVQLRDVDPGFHPEKILSMTVYLNKTKYSDSRAQAAYFEQAIDILQHVPGVEAVGADVSLPFSSVMASLGGVQIDGRPPDTVSPGETVLNGIVSPDYFRALGIPVKAGRPFLSADRDGSPLVALVNESFARRFFPREDPIGRRIQTLGDDWRTIVGVVGDLRHGDLRRAPSLQVFHPYLQSGVEVMSLVVRTRGDPMQTASLVRSSLASLDRDQAVHTITKLEDRLSQSLAAPRTRMQLALVLGAIALLLAAVGLFGLISFGVSQRGREIGLRLALGASRGSVQFLVVRQAMKLVLLGAGIGTLVAPMAGRAMQSLLFEVRPVDPFTFVTTTMLLIFVTLMACLSPARKAARTDPMEALRHE